MGRFLVVVSDVGEAWLDDVLSRPEGEVADWEYDLIEVVSFVDEDYLFVDSDDLFEVYEVVSELYRSTYGMDFPGFDVFKLAFDRGFLVLRRV